MFLNNCNEVICIQVGFMRVTYYKPGFDWDTLIVSSSWFQDENQFKELSRFLAKGKKENSIMNSKKVAITLFIMCSVLYLAKTTTVTQEELNIILQNWKKQIQDEIFQQLETVRSNVEENTCRIDMLASNTNETECREKIMSEYFTLL